MKPFHELLETSAVTHGHLCPGQSREVFQSEAERREWDWGA